MKELYKKMKKWKREVGLPKLMRPLLLSMCALLLAWDATSQERMVSGKVLDMETNEPIPGTTILLKGTSTGTITDSNGEYRIAVADDEAVLSASFVGYEYQEVVVGDRTIIDFSMVTDITALEEVVVIGYGTQRKALNTGANFKVEGEEIQKLSTTNALQGLQGQTPGVQITSTSGQPGEGMRVVIRGAGSLSGTGPLYIVDGVQTGDISYLNPADILSVDVAKDASSAAIYGSRGSNGVIFITTRKGTSGKPKLTFDSYYGVQELAKKVDLLNTKEYLTIKNESAVNSGKLPRYTTSEIDSIASVVDTDWMDEMFVKGATTQNYVLGFSGGSQTSTFSSSLSYTSQEGIVGGKNLSNYERYNFRINSEHKLLNDRVTFGENLTLSYINSNGIAVGGIYGNTLRSAFGVSPLVPMYDSLGNFWNNSNSTWNNAEANPYAQMVYGNQNERSNQKLLGNVYAEVELLKGLKFKTLFGLDYGAGQSHSFTPIYELSIYSRSTVTSASQNQSSSRSLLWDNLLSYELQVSKSRFNILAGTEAIQSDGSWMYGSNRDLIYSDLEHAWLNNATNTDGNFLSLSGAANESHRLMSYFGRIGYDFDEKYVVNASVRADGSSNFAPGNQWGTFVSVSGGWLISNESFLSLSFLDYLKLRGGFGQTGNQNADAFAYSSLIKTSTTNYIFGPEEGVLTPGAYPSSKGNENLKWETSEQINIGFDSRLLNNSVTFSFDWYKKNSNDWLLQRVPLATEGLEVNPWINGGDVTNKGIELALSYSGTSGDLTYTVGVNGAFNDNNVTEVPTGDGIVHGQTNSLFNNSGEFYRAQTGYPLGYFWGLKTAGVFQSDEEVLAHTNSTGTVIQPSAKAGDPIYVDRNDDGMISDLDRTEIGNPNPDVTFGINLSATFKSFDFSMLASGVAGNEIIQSYGTDGGQFGNSTSEILNRWHGPGTSNKIPRVTESGGNWGQISDLFVHDGDYLRINNVTLGYDLASLVKTDAVSKIRVYASALNLYTFTKYNGMDPEVGFGLDGGPQDRFSSGIDVGYYPRPRTYMVGLNVSF